MSLSKREKTSFIFSVGVHVAVIGMMAYGLFSVPSLPEPPQGEIAIDFDLSGGFNNLTLDKAPEKIAKKPAKQISGKLAAADVGQKEITHKIAAEKKQQEQEKKKKQLQEKQKRADEKRKQALVDKKRREEKQRIADLKKKKELAEKKKLEEKRKKDLAEKKRKEDKRKKELAEKKRKEEEKKKKLALLEKKKKAEGKKKRFDDNRIANLLKSKNNNKATLQKSAGSSKDPVADILSKQASAQTAGTGKQGSKNASPAHKLGGGLSWSDKSAIVNALRPCWEKYQGGAKNNVKVSFSFDQRGYLKGGVSYVSGERGYAFKGAQNAVIECASPIKGVSSDKLARLSDGLVVTFTPLDVRL